MKPWVLFPTTYSGLHPNYSTGGMGARGLDAKGYPQLPGDLEGSLGYIWESVSKQKTGIESEATPTALEKLELLV